MIQSRSLVLVVAGGLALGFIGTLYLVPGPEATRPVSEPPRKKLVAGPRDLGNIFEVPVSYQYKLYKTAITVTEAGGWLEIKDASAEKNGLVRWAFGNVRAGVRHKIRLRIRKGLSRGPWAQLRIKYTDKTKTVRFFYLIQAANGKVRPTQDARTGMASVKAEGDVWVIDVEGVAPPVNSSMQVSFLPAVGPKGTVGAVKLGSLALSEQ